MSKYYYHLHRLVHLILFKAYNNDSENNPMISAYPSLDSLPEEILIIILKHCNFPALVALHKTNKHFHELIQKHIKPDPYTLLTLRRIYSHPETIMQQLQFLLGHRSVFDEAVTRELNRQLHEIRQIERWNIAATNNMVTLTQGQSRINMATTEAIILDRKNNTHQVNDLFLLLRQITIRSIRNEVFDLNKLYGDSPTNLLLLCSRWMDQQRFIYLASMILTYVVSILFNNTKEIDIIAAIPTIISTLLVYMTILFFFWMLLENIAETKADAFRLFHGIEYRYGRSLFRFIVSKLSPERKKFIENLIREYDANKPALPSAN